MKARAALIVTTAGLIATTSCCRQAAEAVGEVLAEAIVELTVKELMTTTMIVLVSTADFHVENGRWPESKEELVAFCSDRECDIPADVWATFQDMSFEPLDDGSLRVEYTRVWTDKNGSPCSIHVKSLAIQPPADTDRSCDELKSKLQEALESLPDEECTATGTSGEPHG
jgi:hypothetical protein